MQSAVDLRGSNEIYSRKFQSKESIFKSFSCRIRGLSLCWQHNRFTIAGHSGDKSNPLVLTNHITYRIVGRLYPRRLYTKEKSNTSKMTRPALTRKLGADEFAAFYWLKNELQTFCRKQGWPANGSKAELMQRVHRMLNGDNGALEQPQPSATPGPSSTPRNRATTSSMPSPLELSTRVTPGWRLNSSLRAFFVQEIGQNFRFNQALRDFFKDPQNRTLGDAVALFNEAKQAPKPAIGGQFQFNQHVRSYFAEHPGASRSEMLQAWKERRQTAQALVFSGNKDNGRD